MKRVISILLIVVFSLNCLAMATNATCDDGDIYYDNYLKFGVMGTKAVTLTDISVRTLPYKTTYNVGESFNSTGLTLNASYSDGSTSVVTGSLVCTGFNSSVPGVKTITVIYEGLTTTFNVTVVEPVIPTSIFVYTLPKKTQYKVCESFDPTGLTLMATYLDDSTKKIISGFTCSGFSSDVPGTKTITVEYKGLTTTFNVTVVPDENVVSLSIKKCPDKTVYTYRIDTKLDLSGMELEVTYLSGKTVTLTVFSTCKVLGYSAKPTGQKTILVEYGNQTAQFTVTVKYAWWQWLIRIFLLGYIWY